MTFAALVVDDSDVIRYVLRKAISEIMPSCEVFECPNALEAARFLGSRIPEILFVDLNMPGISGFQFIERLSKILDGRKAPIIVSISADTSHKTVEFLRRFGVYEILPKPFSSRSIAEILLKSLHIAKPRTVLVTDDSSTSRSIIKKVVARSLFNLTPVEASDGHAAIALATQRKFDCVFVDLNMPGIDGIETAGTILYDRPETIIVLISAQGNEKVEREAIHVGIKHFMRKPFYADDINALLHTLFEIRDTEFVKARQLVCFADAINDEDTIDDVDDDSTDEVRRA
ncbi:MAG: response regulator [Ancalomicrobiaceae bacterium]|nr:response regulator [Ancalomicrobiaceae bacterium]